MLLRELGRVGGMDVCENFNEHSKTKYVTLYGLEPEDLELNDVRKLIDMLSSVLLVHTQLSDDVPIAPGEARDALGRVAECDVVTEDIDIVGTRIMELEKLVEDLLSENVVYKSMHLPSERFKGETKHTRYALAARHHGEAFRNHHIHTCASRPGEPETCTCTELALDRAWKALHG